MPRTATGYYSLSATASIGVYVKKNGVWTRVTTRTVAVNGQYTDGAAKTLLWEIDENFQLGTAVQAFGASVESVSGYSGTTAAVNKIVYVSWQIQTGGTPTSATPDGQQTTVTIRPQ